MAKSPRRHPSSGRVPAQVRFFPSFSEHQRESLFHTARAVVYTPQARPPHACATRVTQLLLSPHAGVSGVLVLTGGL